LEISSAWFLLATFKQPFLRKQAFNTLVQIVSVINSQKSSASRRDKTLVSFAQYRFSNPSKSKKLAFDEIFRLWASLIEENSPSLKLLEKFSYFFFEIATKRSD